MKTSLMWLLILSSALLGAAEFRLPTEARVLAEEPADGKCWRQLGMLPLAYAAARRSMALALRRQGWALVRTVDYDLVRWKALEIWSSGAARIMVQYWREEPGLTGFAWGYLEEDKRS